MTTGATTNYQWNRWHDFNVATTAFVRSIEEFGAALRKAGPANRRWFDLFRTFAAWHARAVTANVPDLPAYRQPPDAKQRRADKRRRFVQRLQAAA